MTYEDFISKFEKRVKTTAGFSVKCPAHPDKTPSLSVCKAADGKILLKCFAGCTTAAIVGALGLKMSDLFPETAARNFTVPASNGHVESAVKPVADTIYSYENHAGIEVYQVVRMRPKSFRQRHIENGNWVWNMDGVERVLYHLPEILKSKQIWVVEGEKDADNLFKIGFVGTCNVGGAGKWLDGYTDTLAGKEVVICGDNDEPGQKHVETVFDSICGTAKTVKIVKLPAGIKDASDYIATFKTEKEAKSSLDSLCEAAHPFIKGVRLPIYTMAELESGYQRHVNTLAECSFDLGKWLPSLGNKIRPLISGELVFIIGDTGAGKTGILSAIALAALPLPTLFFELELPPELMFERTVSAKMGWPCVEVEQAYKTGENADAILDDLFKNLFVCTESKMTLASLENYIIKSELKIGQRPRVVLLDYIQLMSAPGPNRREKVSDIAEGLKVLAKSTRTIIVCASQVHRPDGDEEVHLHSAKESGSIENSCGLLIGAWREEKNPGVLCVKVLKSTKGGSGTLVRCNFDGQRMKITELSQVSDSDVPAER